MPKKSPFFDYEPLSSGRLKEQTVEQPDGLAEQLSRSKATLGNESLEDRRQTHDIKPIRDEPNQDKWIFKSGHALSFAGVFLFSFLVFFRPYEFSPSLKWMLLRSALYTAIFTLLVFVPTQLGLENRITIRTREINLILLLLLLSFLSITLSLDRLVAWNGFVEFAKVVVMFIVMVNVVRTRSRLFALLILVLIASTILSLLAVNDYRLGNLLQGGKRIEGAIGGLFENANDLALHLVTFFPIVIGLALGSRNVFGKLFYFAAAFLVVAGIVVTFSRGGFLGLIFVLGTLVWRLGRIRRGLAVIVTILLLSFFLLLAPGAYRQRLATTRDDSAQARTAELKRSIYLAVRHPLLGVGIGNYVLYSDTEHATHNSYTQVAAEIGLPAAIVYVLFLMAATKRARRVPHPKDVEKKDRWLPYLAIGLQASLIGYMVTSFFASVAYLWYVYYIAAYIICVDRLYQTSLNAQKVTKDRRVTPFSESIYLQNNVASKLG